jgi:hypothetical protein
MLEYMEAGLTQTQRSAEADVYCKVKYSTQARIGGGGGRPPPLFANKSLKLTENFVSNFRSLKIWCEALGSRPPAPFTRSWWCAPGTSVTVEWNDQVQCTSSMEQLLAQPSTQLMVSATECLALCRVAPVHWDYTLSLPYCLIKFSEELMNAGHVLRI